MILEVVKGVDDEIEFKGFRGRYFYLLAGCIVALLVVTFLLYAVGLNSFILLFLSSGAGITGYFLIKSKMDRNGRYGHIQNAHQPPDYILHNQPFYKLIPKR